MAVNNFPSADVRKVITGKDGCLYDESGNLMASIEAFQSQAIVTNTSFQPLGSAMELSTMSSYKVTLMFQEIVVEDSGFFRAIIEGLQTGAMPVFHFRGMVRSPYDGREEQMIYRDCVPDGAIDIQNMSVGQTYRRTWRFLGLEGRLDFGIVMAEMGVLGMDEKTQLTVEMLLGLKEYRPEKAIEIDRGGVQMVFRVRALGEREIYACRERHTRGGRLDEAGYHAALIYRATAEKDREMLWDAREAWRAVGALTGEDMVDMLLLAGEKKRALDAIAALSGYLNDGMEREIKN